MDNLVEALSEILSSETGKQKLSDVAEILGGSGDSFDFSKLSSVLNQMDNNQEQQQEETKSGTSDFGFDFSTILKLQSLFSKNNTSNKNAQLIKALKPHMKNENKHKVDDVLKIMQLIEMLPLLKEMGILDIGSIFGGKGNE